MNGSIDRSQFDDTANGALTPDVLKQTSAILSSYGHVQRIEFAGTERSGSKTVHAYKVTYSDGHVILWQMGLDPNGKIFAFSGS